MSVFSQTTFAGAPAPDQSAPAIDLVHLARATMDDPALEVELLEMFDAQTARSEDELTRAAPRDRRRVSEIAHRLRGSALALGAGRVAAAAAALEAGAAADGDIAPLVAALIGAAREARVEIARMRA